jgi:single stranded DNA-binding protein
MAFSYSLASTKPHQHAKPVTPTAHRPDNAVILFNDRCTPTGPSQRADIQPRRSAGRWTQTARSSGLRETSTGLTVCKLRVASTARRKSSDGSGYEDRPSYFNVTVWGGQGENAAEHLSKGRSVALDGRLEWREWEAPDSSKRQGVDIVADSVQFLGTPQTNSEDAQLPLKTRNVPSRRPARRAAPQRSYAHA